MSESYYFLFALVAIPIFRPIYRRVFLYLLLNKGKTLFIDEKGARVIKNHEYRVTAKPDRASLYRNKKYLLEYKSRKKGIFKKDVVQALTGSLALWDSVGGFNGVIVYNDSYDYKLIKVRSKKGVYRKIKKYITKAQKIKSGKTVYEAVTAKNCGVCPYAKSGCKKSKRC